MAEQELTDRQQQQARDDALLRVARRRFQQAEEAENAQRVRQVDSLRFRAGDQWPAAILAQRNMERRPCLTINRTNAFVNQVVNEQQQQPPGIKVSPVDSGADPDVAKIYQGLIRHIEHDSNAVTAYMTAFDHAVTHGRGYVRLLLDYDDPMSFDLCIKIGRIQNPLTVYMDPTAKELDYSDAQWGFIVDRLDRDEFATLYPGVESSTMDQWASLGDGWIQKHEVRIAEYFAVERHAVTLVQLADGQVLTEEQLTEGMEIINARPTLMPVVHQCKIAGHIILERTVWPGRWIPIIPVLGKELLVDGKVRYDGIVESLKDSQRQYNFWSTAGTELIALAPRAPWLLDPRQIEGYERYWKTANIENHAYLPYKATAVNGEQIPPPQRQAFEPPIQALSQFMLFAADDMKSVSGIYDASLGARSNETSGKAIQSRQQQGNTANYHFSAALGITLRQVGRCCVDLIPRVYDQPRVLRIIGEGNEERVVTVNAPHQDAQGNMRVFDLTTGRYDVTVSMGPSYQTKRQESVDNMTTLAQAYPPLLEKAGDLVFKNMDWPGADEVARRFRKMLPPGLADEDPGATPEDQVAQMHGALQQMQQQLAALNAYAEQRDAEQQQLAQENAHLADQVRSKDREWDLKERELALQEREMELRMAIERQKVAIQEDEVDLQALAMRQARAAANGVDTES